MATKPYSQTKETPLMTNEPMVAYQTGSNSVNVYQVTDTERDSIMRAKEQFARGEFCTESEMDKMVAK